MLKKTVKRLFIIILVAVPLDWLLQFLQKISSKIAFLIYFRDWQLQINGLPQFFKHQINLSCWRFEPLRWSFTARGVYARENMFKGCVVLDLCCGDGSYSYLFFSDIAKTVDAVDNDPNALAYAKRFFTAPVIKFHKINIVDQPLPVDSDYYDVIVWNAAICYFSENEIKIILRKIVNAGKRNMVLCGMLPQASGYVDHKFEFQDVESILNFLHEYFSKVIVKEVVEMSTGGLKTNISFYFSASEPLYL